MSSFADAAGVAASAKTPSLSSLLLHVAPPSTAAEARSTTSAWLGLATILDEVHALARGAPPVGLAGGFA